MSDTTKDRACVRCEGHGVVRNYYNNAGNYVKYHCPDCDGTGRKHGPLLTDQDVERFKR